MLDLLRNTTLDPADIRINGGTQSRVRIDLQTVTRPPQISLAQ